MSFTLINDTPPKPFHLCNPLLGKKIGLFPTIYFGEVNLSLGDIILYLGELGQSPRKIGLTRGTCPSPTFSLGEVKLSAIFSLWGKNLPFEGVILSSSRISYATLFPVVSPSLNFSLMEDMYKLQTTHFSTY